ncbi:MAG: Abi family protein [Candidatus Omnitrophica bacterium]|nr:Abi family protein [Candidatus Omnitrophota bacterium]
MFKVTCSSSLVTMLKSRSFFYGKYKTCREIIIKISKGYRALNDVFHLWLYALVGYTRNICAHHARLWNSRWITQPAILLSSECLLL